MWTDFSCLERNCTDSAAASTAMSAGVKTHSGVLGLDAQGRHVQHFLDCLEDPLTRAGSYRCAGGESVWEGLTQGAEGPCYVAYLDNTALPRALCSLWPSAPPARVGVPYHR